jgi:hypothetical protein
MNMVRKRIRTVEKNVGIKKNNFILLKVKGISRPFDGGLKVRSIATF